MRKPRVSRVNICIIVSRFTSSPGGCQKHLSLLIHQYLKKNHTLFLLTKSTADTSSLSGVRIISIPDPFPENRILSGLFFIFLGFLQLLLHHSEIDVVHAKQMYSSTTIGVLGRLLLRIPVVSKNTATNEIGEVNIIRQLPFHRIRLWLLRRVNYFIALTTQTQLELKSIGIPSERIEVIPNGVVVPQEAAYDPNTRERYRKKLCISKPHVFIYTGRFAEEKNLDIMIEAIHRLRSKMPLEDLLCIFLGEGGQFRSKEGALRTLVKDHGLDPVIHFIPPVPHVYDYLLASDCLFLLSTSEGLSNSLLEGMVCGNIILATDIDANRDFLSNEINSLLVPVRDTAETVLAVERIITQKESLFELGRKAREAVQDTISIESIAERHCELYRRAIGSIRGVKPSSETESLA